MARYYVSNVSLLTMRQMIAIMLGAMPPSFNDMLILAKKFGFHGLDVIMFRGWRPADFLDRGTREVSSVSAPWNERGEPAGRMGDSLFGLDAHKRFDKFLAYKSHIPSVDAQDDKKTRWEVARKDDRWQMMKDILNGCLVPPDGIVYDTLHALEMVPCSSRNDWCPPSLLKQIFIPPAGYEKYYGKGVMSGDGTSVSARRFAGDVLVQAEKLFPHTKMFQVQTRSWKELDLFLSGTRDRDGPPCLLTLQVEAYADYCQKNDIDPVVVVELPPWFYKSELKATRQRLSQIFRGK